MEQTRNFLIGLIVVLVAAIFGMYYYFESSGSAGGFRGGDESAVEEGKITRLGLLTDEVQGTLTTRTESQLTEYADLIGPSIRSGDREQAIAAIDFILESEDQFPVAARSRAKYNSGIAYDETGDFQDVIDSIRGYKDSVADAETSPKWKARTLNILATAYCAYGRDTRIIEEVFNTEPYATMLREAGDDPMMASLAILQWSYDLYPTPRAAVLIGRAHAIEAVGSEGDERTNHIALAEQWLQEAAGIASTELSRTAGRANDYKDSRRYFSYLHWRSFTISALALAGVEEYRDRYRAEQEQLFAFMEEQGLENTKQYEPFCYWMYGYFLENIDGDTKLAQEYFSRSVEAAENYDVGTNYFEVFVRNESAHEPMDIFGEMLEFAYNASEDFKGYIDAVR